MKLQRIFVITQQNALGKINDSITNIFGIKIIGNYVTELEKNIKPAVKKWALWDKKTREFYAYYVDNSDSCIVVLMSAAQYIFYHIYINKMK